jgi:hypothetical protein
MVQYSHPEGNTALVIGLLDLDLEDLEADNGLLDKVKQGGQQTFSVTPF